MPHLNSYVMGPRLLYIFLTDVYERQILSSKVDIRTAKRVDHYFLDNYNTNIS